MTQAVAADHADYIHDIAYDYYGRRIATCSSDQHIKIWTQTADLKWLLQADWKAHYGPVWRVTWAHPEFGQVLASCSFDHNVLVWEEQEGVDDKGRVVSRWHKRAQLGDARDSINDIKFAPRHMGLKIAAGSADGFVRVYEATDATSLSHWQCTEEFDAEPASSGGVACLAWTTSSFDAPMMVVGGGSCVKIWGYGAGRKWTPMFECSGHGGRVHDVAWAPNIGRSYHLVATAGGDGRVGLWKLVPEGEGVGLGTGEGEGRGEEAPATSIIAAGATWNVKSYGVTTAMAMPVAAFDDHNSLAVWRVEFNMTGTVLASSGDDGTLRLRRQNLSGLWETVAAIDTHAGTSDEVADSPKHSTAAPATTSIPAAHWSHAPEPSSGSNSGYRVAASSIATSAPAGGFSAFGATAKSGSLLGTSAKSAFGK